MLLVFVCVLTIENRVYAFEMREEREKESLLARN